MQDNSANKPRNLGEFIDLALKRIDAKREPKIDRRKKATVRAKEPENIEDEVES